MNNSSRSCGYKWSWWRGFLSSWKFFLYMDYSIRAKRHMKRGKRSERELRVLHQFVDPNRASIDIGANQGVYTYWLNKYSKKVYAYEANKDMVDSFLKGACGNVEVRPFGVSDFTGTQKMFIPVIGLDRSKGSGNKKFLAHKGATLQKRPKGIYQEKTVKVYRLDELEHDPVGFIKIDVEGLEMKVIAGAKALIQRDRPVMMVEINQAFHKLPIHDLIRDIESLGYKAKVLSPEEFRHPFQIDQEYFRDGHPHFINNFFFVPEYFEAVRCKHNKTR